jgi:membrane-associated phospholipid phosphatase
MGIIFNKLKFFYLLFFISLPAGALEIIEHTSALPYMPSVRARHAIELLIDEAQLQLLGSHWPLPARSVTQALDGLAENLPAHLAAARELVKQEIWRSERGGLKASIQSKAESAPGFGDDYTPGSHFAVRSSAAQWGSPEGVNFSMRLGLKIEQNSDPVLQPAAAVGINGNLQPRADDSAFIAEFDAVDFQVFSRQNWWGPGWQSSLASGSNIPAWNGLGLQRSTVKPSESQWLQWLGPWNWEIFVARAQDPVIAANQPNGFLFTGTRVTFQPTPWAEVALTRTIQSAGNHAPGGVGNWFRALRGNPGDLNVSSANVVDVANEMAGFDLRLSCAPLGLRCAGYAQLYADDSANGFPTKYGGIFGVESWSANGRHRWVAEYTDTRADGSLGLLGKKTLYNVFYLNSHYPQAYSNGGRWAGSAFGSDSQVLTLGWFDSEQLSWMKLHLGEIGHSLGSYNGLGPDNASWAAQNAGCDQWHPCSLFPSPYASGRLIGLTALKSWQFGDVLITPALSVMHLASGSDAGNSKRTNARVGIEMSLPLFEPYHGMPAGFFGDNQSTLNQGFFHDAVDTGQGIFKDALPSITSNAAIVASVLLAGLALDRPMDHWAKQHQNGFWGHAGSAATQLPLFLGAAVVAQGLGAFGEGSDSGLAWSALKATGYTLAANTLVRNTLGRSRPQDNLGPENFNGFSSAAGNSSMPSNHAGVAFALITPYARQYDMPWLYGLGALTMLGRVQQRQHWASDTVAGGLIGYGIGSSVSDHDVKERGMKVSVSSNSMSLVWPF